jgi:hypothetical protein
MNILSFSQSQSSYQDRKLLRCIERGLQKFDSKLCPIVFSKFEVDYGLSKEDIIRSPDLFLRTLQQIFRFGSQYVEKEIVKEIKMEFGFENHEYIGFVNTVIAIRQQVMATV